MEKKKRMKRNLSLFLILTMMIATWMGVIPGTDVQAATKPVLNKSTVNVLAGKTTKLKLKKKITGAKIRWKSRNKKIATVSKSGKVKGIKKGNTRVTATVTVNGKNYNLNCKVKVIKKASKIQITYDNGKTASPIPLKVGQSIRLRAKNTSPKDSNDFISSWKSGNGKVATVNKNGEVVAVNAGEATITATAFGKAKASIRVKVEGNVTEPTPTVKPPTNPTAEPAPSTVPTTNPTPPPTPTITPTSNPSTDPTQTPLYYSSFENGTDGFGGRGQGANVARVTTTAYNGRYSLYVTGRSDNWHGATVNATNFMKMGNKYLVRGYVRQDTGSDQNLKISLEYAYPGGGNTWPEVAETVCKSGEWTLIEGYVEVDATPPTINLYFEMPANKTANFYVDEVSVYWDSKVEIQITPPEGSLKEAYKELFKIGTAVTSAHLLDENENDKLEHVVEQYDSVTMENEMKPDAILRGSPIFEDALFDRSTLPESYEETKVPKLNFSTVDRCLEVARQKGLKMRGHTLVWHSQTPAWFFMEEYSTSPSAKLVSEEVMDARMEFYIKTVLEHVQDNYPDVIYAWDVCNEVFTNDGSSDYNQSLRGGNPAASGESSNWYSIYKSDEFVIKAFTYAKTYKAEGVSLFYNDYNEYMPNKTNNIVTLATKLYNIGMESCGESLIDGIGMQSHIDLSYPSVDVVAEAIDQFAAIGDGALEIQLTELDVTINYNGATGGTLEKQTEYYRDLMKMVVAKKRGGTMITNVTLWGFYDEMSWRGSNKPLLLNYYPSLGFSQKGAFKSVLEAPFSTPTGFDVKNNGTAYGTLTQTEYASETTGAMRKCYIYTPPNYDASQTYPVLYLLHGIGGTHSEWLGGNPNEIISNLIASGEVPPLIAVFPNVRAMRDDSAPSDSDMLGQANINAFDNFINDLRNDLMPFIKENYPISDKREDTAIAGLSMGGREALFIGASMPETFGYIGAFSPAPGLLPYPSLSYPGQLTAAKLTIPSEYKDDTFMLICNGNQDGVVNDVPYEYSQTLLGNGVEHVYYTMDGGHDFTVWKNGLYNFVKNIFNK